MTLVTSANPSIKLHDIGRRQEVGSIPYSSDDMAFSVDAKLLAVADRKENVVRIWDVDRGGVRITMNDVGENIEHLVFCAQDKLLATVNKEDTVIQFWDWAAGRSVFRMNAHPECANGIDALAVSADGKVLASAGLRLGRPSSEDGYTTIRSILGSEIKLWDVATGKLLKTLTGRTNRHIPALLFSPNGKYLITVYETSIDIWDTSTWKLVKTLEHKMDWYFRYADVSPDGKFLAAGGWEENCIIIWKIDN
jgi:WD40 repeat protein